ncbi:MAG: hypothetical protein CVV44_08690 [Spirochaetae bacterium HGW-Spirochaetae-1]|jgi:AraC-like DNA-binding protein|nr:MAG: hypothetical protein CVV44_08690 [Spirochaetae bacterium HGW-Spirochaetae-1]
MFCQEYIPSQQLSSYIKSFILIEDEEGAFRNQPMNIYPSGHLEMIISFGDRVIFSTDNYQLKSASGYLGGQILEPVYYRCLGNLRILSVIFRPYGIYRFLDIPQVEFNGRRIDLDLVMGRPGKDFIARLCDEPSREKKISLADSFFCNLLSGKAMKALHIARASFFLNNFRNDVNISSICTTLNVSIKTLERDFRRIVGITPKELSRVLRFNEAFNRINSGKCHDLQDLIFECGYYDQAHFINEFRLFTSLTPTAFINKQKETVERSFREVVKI